MGEKNNSETTEKSISDTDFKGLWGDMSHNQQRFAVAMLESSSKKVAALAIGVEPDTVYRWGESVDLVIEYMKEEARDSALLLLESSIVKAAAIKRAGLDSGDEKVRQDVASELLDRILGRAKQTTEISGPDGAAIIVNFTSNVNDDQLWYRSLILWRQ